ncbi:hypothetical protein IAR55_004012 [Kwoniella newhampshirensis]|uniref:Uncharacterized protein n=1 Tax=Kwoniella newhampshirensis TaxID=1651941 RepID=A0AAW0YMB9_9TREE
MPVDADAYMAGAIPALSRGGSWLPDQALSLPQGSLPPAPQSAGLDTPSSFGRPLIRGSSPFPHSPFPQTPQTPPPSNHYLSFPLYSPDSPWSSSSPMGSQRAQSQGLFHRSPRDGPLRHHQWVKVDAGSSVSCTSTSGNWSFDPDMRDARSIGSLPLPQSASHARSHMSRFDSFPPAARVYALPIHGDLSLDKGRQWEKYSGSPKPMTAEPNYKLAKDPALRADIPTQLTGSSQPNPDSPYRKLRPEEVDSHLTASSYLRVPKIKNAHPPSPTSRSANEVKRPPIQRRHSAAPHLVTSKPKFSPEPDLTRSAQLNSRLARLSLQGRDCRTPDPKPVSPQNLSPNTMLKGGRPSMSRRHTSSESTTASSLLTLPVQPIHHRVVDQLRRTRYVSTPHRMSRSDSGYFSTDPHRPGLQCLDTSRYLEHKDDHRNSPAISPLNLEKSSLSSERAPPSRAASPRSRTNSSAVYDVQGHRERPRIPPGYISPLADDGYDRHSPHPAAPVPERAERQLRTTRSHQSSSQPSEAGRQTSQSVSTKPENYIPIGYARPVNEIPWNRTGPAMKTHGIAWLREGNPEALPDGPEGPRWEIARPPRAGQVLGGGWWQSGGDGTSAES